MRLKGRRDELRGQHVPIDGGMGLASLDYSSTVPILKLTYYNGVSHPGQVSSLGPAS